MIVIGSYAAHLSGLTMRREFKDLDLIGAQADVERFRQDNSDLIAEEKKIYDHRYRFQLKSGAPFAVVEIDIAQSPSDRMLADLCTSQTRILNSDIQAPPLEVLYLIKRAHAARPNTFRKTIADLATLKPVVGSFTPAQMAYYQAARRECEERYTRQRGRFDLALSNDELLVPPTPPRVYPLNELRKLVAYNLGQPKMLWSGPVSLAGPAEAAQFAALSLADQLAAMREEFMAVGLERFYLGNKTLGRRVVYTQGMQKTVRDLLVGSFQDFCLDHIGELTDPPPFDFIGRFETAVRQARIRPVKMSPVSVTEDHRRAMSLIQKGELGAARPIAEDLARRSAFGGDPHAFFLLGMIFAKQKNLPLAEKCFRKCLSRAPENNSGWFQLGALLRQAGRDKDAIAALNKAIALNLDTFGVHANLGMALESQKQAKAAIESYAKALALKPDAPDIRARMDALVSAAGQA